MNVKGLRAFIRIMETGTLNAAAVSMHISESALSRQLSLFEAELDLLLFSRDKRRLRPTREGEAFYREAQRLLGQIERIPKLVADIKGGPRRRLRVIAMPRIAHAVAVPAVSEFLRDRPDVEVLLDVQRGEFLERWVATQEFDIGIGALPARHAAIETERICRVPAVVVLHPEHHLASRRAVRLEELASEHLIALSPNTLTGHQVTQLLADADVHPRSFIQVTQAAVCCNFVAEGMGVAITDAMMPQLFGDRVRLVPLEVTLKFDFGLIYLRNAVRGEETRALAEIVKRHARSFVQNLNFGSNEPLALAT